MRITDSSGISLSFDDSPSSNPRLCPGNFFRKSIESNTSQRRPRGAESFGHGSRCHTRFKADRPHPEALSGLVCAAAVMPSSPPRASAAATPGGQAYGGGKDGKAQLPGSSAPRL
ncbi:hypothetical protein MRX96_045884 [Rhipicephalus microplus]